MLKRWIKVLSLLAVLSLFAAACGSSDSDSTDSGSSTASASAASDDEPAADEDATEEEAAEEDAAEEATEETTPPPPQPKHGGTMVIATTQVGANVNHGVNSGIGIAQPSSKIFASLTHLDSNWEPQPYLAESWEVYDDSLTITFHLVKDATFHDGYSITSADVKFSIEVIQANHPFTGMWGPLESIEKPDKQTEVQHLANHTSHPLF